MCIRDSLGIDVGGSTSDILLLAKNPQKGNQASLFRESSVRLAAGVQMCIRDSHETFRKLLARVYEGLAAIKNDMVSMDRKNSSQERLGQVLSEMCNEQRQNQEKMETLFCETNDTIRKNAVKTSNINHHFSPAFTTESAINQVGGTCP